MVPLVFSEQPKHTASDLAKRRSWTSACGRYAVVESVSNYGLPTIFHAIYIEDGMQRLIGHNCKSYSAAVDLCLKHASRTQASHVTAR